jgi:ribonuclease P protein component
VAAHSFPRSARLTRPSEFKRVFRQSVLSSDRCFRVLAVPGKASVTRLGMAVSRRAERTAVGRNRIKRIVRESFRHRFIGTGVATGHTSAAMPLDIVVLPHPGCATISNAQLFQSLDAHWARIVAKFPVAPECP